MELARQLGALRGEIIQSWLRRMRTTVAPANLPREQLLDSLPEFLEELSTALSGEVDAKLESAAPIFDSATAQQHARQRLDLGLDTIFIIREYGVLRDCIFSAFEEAAAPLNSRDSRLLSAGVDAGAMRAISHFVHLRDERERQALGKAHSDRASPESALQTVRRAEAALQESEQRFRLLVESVQDYGMFMVSVDGRVSGWNPGAERLKGYAAEEIVGAHLSRFFGPEDIAERVPERLIHRAAVEDHSEYEGWLVRKDGSRFWSTVSLYAIRDEHGTLRGFSNVARDNTARRRSEQTQQFLSEGGEALASSLNYRDTLEQLALLPTRWMADWCAIFVLSPDRREVFVSHRDPEKQPLLQSAVRAVPEPTEERRGVAEVAKTGEAELCPDTKEASWVRAALGVETPEQLQLLGARSYICVPLKVRGETFAVMALVSSEPGKSLGDLDLEAAQELARRGALAVENARLFRDAREAVQARDEFISMASHDLRSPLTSAGLHIDKVLRRARAGGANLEREAVTADLEKLQGQVSRLIQMMDSLLDITTIAAGRMQLEKQSVDLNELATRAAERLQEDFARANCELRVRTEGRVEGVWDPFRIEQVIVNLVSNAVKYGEGRPVELMVEGDERTARLTVKDLGIGIAYEDQRRLFERFERVRADSGVGGHGVGLWIVRRIVEAHGGRIRLTSREGEGATFQIDLPRWPTASERPEHRLH